MKKTMFFENAKLLAEQFDIIPLMYGSLGLEYITGESLDADDIDVLIPEAFLTVRWAEFKSFLESKGYVLFDEHEHTFCKDDVYYSYASVEELKTFVGIQPSQIQKQNKNDVQFGVLTLEQYLNVYLKSATDGYRVNVRKKKDDEKIEFILWRLSIR